VTHSPEPADGAEPLTAAEEQEVSALLADALGRGPVPPPPSVTTRLDDVLAGLVAERASGERDPSDQATTDTVVRLDARRRLPRILLAAAAVVVGGYAVGNLGLGGSLTGGDDGGSADSAGGSAGGGRASQAHDGRAARDNVVKSREMALPPAVRPDHLSGDVRRVVRLYDRPVPGPEDGSSGSPRRVAEIPDCPIPRLTDSQRLYQVRFQDANAGLVVGAPRGGQADVTIYSCRTGGVVLAATVPAP
jgi:hypothetical protein